MIDPWRRQARADTGQLSRWNISKGLTGAMSGSGRLHCRQLHANVRELFSKSMLIDTKLPPEIDMRTNPILAILAGALAAVLLAATPAQAAAAALSKADQKIVLDIAQGNMAEIAVGKMALGKSKNEQVKTFAQQMIDDHTTALGAVQQLAAAKGVSMPTDIDKPHKAMAAKLDAKSGAAFDKTYMAQGGVADHQKMHSMLAAAGKKARDPDVKALVTKMLPTVDQHLKAARQMGRHKAMANGDKPTAATDAGR
jgi:putative membrane protein